MKYLGTEQVKIEDSPFKDYLAEDWVLYLIESFGQFDGAHHKQWVLDQIARVVKNPTFTILKRSWSDGKVEYEVDITPSEKYRQWVLGMKSGEDGPDTYDYDEGIAP